MLKLKRRQQNQKFPSFQIFRLGGGVVGGAANKNGRKFLGFAPRELVERGRGAKIIRQNPADFARNSFELCPIHTALVKLFFYCSSRRSVSVAVNPAVSSGEYKIRIISRSYSV